MEMVRYAIDRFVLYSATHVTAILRLETPRAGGTLVGWAIRAPYAVAETEVRVDVLLDASTGRATAHLEAPGKLPPEADPEVLERYATVWFGMAEKAIRGAAEHMPAQHTQRSWVETLEQQHSLDGPER